MSDRLRPTGFWRSVAALRSALRWGGASQPVVTLNSPARIPASPPVVSSTSSLVTRPRKPDWAAVAGTDEYGDYADLVLSTESSRSVRQRLRWIAPGRFIMGSPAGEAGRSQNEGPQHKVSIALGFWLFDTPCTQALWQAVMGDNPSRHEDALHPVAQVSFAEVLEFLTKINVLVPGLKLTLPSEAQWEYACRAGTTTATYVGDLEISENQSAPLLDTIAWYDRNRGKQPTHDVAQKLANPWGLYDMLGNVWERCADLWHDSYDGAPKDGSAWVDFRGAVPVLPPRDIIRMGRAAIESGRLRGAAVGVMRGGSWYNGASMVRAASRARVEPTDCDPTIGFRGAQIHMKAK